MTVTKYNIKLNFKSRKNIPIYILSAYFLIVLSIYLGQAPFSRMQNPLIALILILWLGVTVLSIIEVPVIRKYLKIHAVWINALVLIISPVVSFLMVETMVSNYNMKMLKAYSFYNLIWYVIIYYLVYALLRNSKHSIIISNLLIYAAAVINYLVYLFRGNPILPSDLLAWRTGISVASHYDLSISQGYLTATLIMITLFVVGNKLEKTAKQPSILNRLAGACTYIIFILIVFHAFFETDLIRSKIRVLDFFAPKYTYTTYGTAFGFVANVQAMETDYPKGYSVDKVAAALKEVSVTSKETVVVEEKPNIIAIMNEAFSDLSMLGDYAVNMPYLPYTSTLEENTTKGTMYVSVFGGATSDTEYEFLTGNSMAVLPQNCVPYQQFVTEPTDSLATTLKAQGYYNIAIHPYAPSGYKRDLVYPLLGFDEFLSLEDFVKPQLIRAYVSDLESYRKIIEQYESKGDESPLFIFNVTMQNHGGYSASQVFSDEDTVRLTEKEGYGVVEQYLSLLRESDKAFEMLTKYFMKQDEHTIILLFGDHQPVAYSKLHDELEKQKLDLGEDIYQERYMVPFILWANYDISEDDVDKISANYLSSYLLKTADLKGSVYNDYLMELYQEVPVINALFYIDKEDNIHSLSEANEQVTEYQYIGYNNALDKKDRLQKYYRLK